MGWVPRGSLQKDFEAACLASKENQLLRTKTTFGFHLFIVEGKKTMESLSAEQKTQQSAQVSEALRLLSNSIVTRTVPEAHPSWALKSPKETKSGPKDKSRTSDKVSFEQLARNTILPPFLLGNIRGGGFLDGEAIGSTLRALEKRRFRSVLLVGQTK